MERIGGFDPSYASSNLAGGTDEKCSFKSYPILLHPYLNWIKYNIANVVNKSSTLFGCTNHDHK